MNVAEAKKKIEFLTSELNEHNYRYYVLSSPTISDYDFDMMLKELEKLEQELADADTDYQHFLETVQEIKAEYVNNGLTPKLKQDLSYLEEDLLDFWIDKRGLAEALEQARKGNIEEAKQLLENVKTYLEAQKEELIGISDTQPATAYIAMEKYIKQAAGLPCGADVKKVYMKLKKDSSLASL